MNPSKDISDQILKCVENCSQEILNSHKTTDENDSMSNAAQHFLKLFSTNLATAINIVYFKEDDEAANAELRQNQDDMEYEKAVMDVIGKRRQGTKVCKDILEKTLAIEKKAVMALEVGPGVVNVQEFERQPVPYKKEELKLGAKKTLSNIKNSAIQVIDLNDRAEELIKAAFISKEADAIDFGSPY